jgi:capsular polysaccharide biosynthesis protein
MSAASIPRFRWARLGAARDWRRNARLPPLLVPLVIHWRLVLAAIAGTLAGSAVWLVLHPVRYSARATFLADPLPPDEPALLGLPGLHALTDETQSVQSAASLLRSPVAAEQAARELGNGWTADSVLGALKITPVASSNLVNVSATAASAADAIRLANAYANAVALDRRRAAQSAAATALSAMAGIRQPGPPKTPTAEQQQLQPQSTATILAQHLSALDSVLANGDPTLTLVHPAVTPATPTRGSPVGLLLLALAAGLLMGGGGAHFLQLNSRSAVAGEDDLVAVTGLPVLGRMSRLWDARRGTHLVHELLDEMDFVITQLELLERPSQVLLVTSPARDDGGTGCAITLAIALARREETSVLLDLDAGGPSVAECLGMPSSPPFDARTVGTTTPLAELLVDHPVLPRVRVASLAAATGTGAADELLNQLPIIAADARRLADHVILVAPPWSETADAMYVMDVADTVIVVARPSHTSVMNAAATAGVRRRAEDVSGGLILIGGQRGARKRAAASAFSSAG